MPFIFVLRHFHAFAKVRKNIDSLKNIAVKNNKIWSKGLL